MRDYATLPFFIALRRASWLRRLARVLMVLAAVCYFAFALIFLTLRYAVLPHIEDYRGDIERMLSGSLNLPVAIAGIDAHWQGLRPHLGLSGFTVHDREGRPALSFDKVEADVSWTSLLHLGLRLDRLEIVSPSLAIRRDREGQLFVAGLKLASQTRDSGFSDWLLAQHRVVVRNATITWQDELRAAPMLELNRVNFHLQNNGSRHRFGFTADPPAKLAARIELRGDFKGDELDVMESWKGEAYAELDYADLAVWRTWIDYPLELSQGSGGMRLWLGFGQKQLNSFTADISLAQARLRLGKDLPLLDLKSVNGRLGGKRIGNGFEVGAKGLALTTIEGINIEPTDFRLLWTEAQDRKPEHGEFAANGLDLDALSKLATHLPFDLATRKQLTLAAPHGKLFDLKLAWSGAADAPTAYTLNARFERLGMHALGILPGFEGVSGSIAGSEKAGSLKLASKNAWVDMPAIFADPRLALESLNVQAGWAAVKEGIEVKLDSVAFANRDATGFASGRYLGRAGEPGEIDLSARLTRAEGGVVWRYMPISVGREVRDWLHASITGGSSKETTLRLKGDLKKFPFSDGSGIFEVKGKFSGATLRYAPSWPQIDNITGELEFVGRRMTIRASRGSIFGVTVSDVKAQIDDLMFPESPLLISGRANGPTADFLRFVEASPVAERIDHFTEGMAASGNGQLDLKLTLPLHRLGDSKIDGAYQFINNRLLPDPDLPPLSEANGRLLFSGDRLKAEKVRANFLGMPLTVDVTAAGDGTVTLSADGGFNIAVLRQQYSQPLLDHLSGSTNWHGSARVRKKNADIVIESRLVGISSSLPEPFNKIAVEALPLRFERKLLAEPQRTARRNVGQRAAPPPTPPSPRDQIDLALGNILAARLLRRFENEKPLLERGAVSIGAPLVLPEKGLTLEVNLQKIDADFWRGQFIRGGDGDALPLTAIGLKAGELTVYGHSFHDLGVMASPKEGGWHAQVKSRELSGDLDWRGQGAGRLFGHLKQFALNDTAKATAVASAPGELPGLDIEVEQFLLRGKPFGVLKVSADNIKGVWEAKLDIDNEDGKLSGTGKWQPSPTLADTRMQFTLTAKSIEKLLTRLGYPNAVRRGQATLEGSLSWNGTPFAIDYPSLDGALSILASGGQFNKLEPGAGRLLGILSLQSLPRRITLDFRDVFSEGFAFDTIAGQFNLSHGVMESKDLRIQGPAAKILMSGSVNLPQETQNLKVRVQPAIGESLSVGAILMAHPAAGAIAYLVQKLLRDPLDQAFAYEYAVTGTWTDPKVDKLSAPQVQDPGRPASE